jgi:probable lipoprotein NlpC
MSFWGEKTVFCRYNSIMKTIFSIVLVFCFTWLIPSGIFAAPLEGGFAQAPKTSASPEEKESAFLQARYKVIEAAAQYENTPYRYAGLSKSGLDCSGFIYVSFKDALGVSTPRSSTGLYSWAEKITLDQAQPGDLLFFRTNDSDKISHVALYLGGRDFIHSASSGPRTGVIYSSLDETYWARNYVSSGRVFPESHSGFTPVLASAGGSGAGKKPGASSGASGGSWGGARTEPPAASSPIPGKGRLLLGAAIAPTWNAFLANGDVVRGVAGQLHMEAETYMFGSKMVFGLQLRPEYDGGLEVFRLPITFSWGPSYKFMIFAGPVLSWGDPVLTIKDEKRNYTGGTSWLGAIGVTAAPFNLETSAGEFAPYVEAAWQYYIKDNEKSNANADFAAGFRFSTGLRWTVQAN